MKPIPADQIQSRVMSALIDDLWDREATGFPRCDAVREIIRQSREAGESNKPPASNS
jgi:ribosomal 50S subunit-associated protein YjgA (DUF615 family)